MARANRLLLVALLTIGCLGSTSWGQVPRDRKAEIARYYALKPIDRELTTRGGHGDFETWYVIAMGTVAERHTMGMSVLARDGQCIVIKGRKEAANAVLDYLSQPATLSERAIVDQRLRNPQYFEKVGANRLWRYQAFRTELEAKLFFATVVPKEAIVPSSSSAAK